MIAVRDIAWAAGFFEGEGAFGCPRFTPQIQVAQVNREPLEALERVFGGRIYACSGRGRGRNYFMWTLYGVRAAGLMMTVLGLMSERRRGQITAALAKWRSAPMPRAEKTHCPAGHAYAGANLYVVPTDGSRRCRACARTARARLSCTEP